MTDRTDLAAWLRAQLDEDEMVAAEAIQATTGRWTARETDWGGGTVVEDDCGAMILPTTRTGGMQYQHIAAHDPARVLRAIAAKRRVIADYEDAERTLSVAGPGTPPHDIMTGATNTLRRMLRLLAAEYADRPGYREEWRP